MRRYVTLARRPARATGYDDWWDTEGPDQITVHEEEDEPQATGLLDQHGNNIFSVRERVPMGFRVKRQ